MRVFFSAIKSHCDGERRGGQSRERRVTVEFQRMLQAEGNIS